MRDLLRGQGFEVLHLYYATTIKHARRVRRVSRPYFPRYVFASVVEGTSLAQINRTIGVSTVVCLGDKPLEIPATVIEELRARGNEQGLVRFTPADQRQARKRFRRGEAVRITDGPMAGLLATVALDSGSAIRVWLEMFGGQVEALFDPKGLRSSSPEGGTVRRTRPHHRSRDR